MEEIIVFVNHSFVHLSVREPFIICLRDLKVSLVDFLAQLCIRFPFPIVKQAIPVSCLVPHTPPFLYPSSLKKPPSSVHHGPTPTIVMRWLAIAP